MLSRTLIKTQDYLDVFARFKQKENIEAVERTLATRSELELFERAQLGMYPKQQLIANVSSRNGKVANS